MFYVEVHLDKAGQLVDVKVAHHGENPAVRGTFLVVLSSVEELSVFSCFFICEILSYFFE